MRPLVLATAASLLSLATGCSFALVHGPPSPPIARAPEVDCTRSDAAPIVDLWIGGAAIALGIAGLAYSEPSCAFCPDLSPEFHKAGAILFGVGTLALVSSVVGHSKAGACREVTERQRACAQGSAAACDRLEGRP